MVPLFPNIDPIPLPAPVGFFKFFDDVTLTLHFLFLHLLLGGLVLGIIWNFLGHMRKSSTAIESSGVVLSRLPILMTYVINLGVPPLLFAQVLYGRAIYTSSLLIGFYWIGVIPALIIGYFLLYYAGKKSDSKKVWWFWGLLSLTCFLYVGKVYATNMTLMLNPEVWAGMYNKTTMGTALPPYDPTRVSRFLLMMTASLGFGGLGISLYATKKSLREDVRIFLRKWGGVGAIIGLVLLLASGCWAYQVQPDYVRGALSGSPIYGLLMVTWFLCVMGSLMAAGALVWQPQYWSFGRGVWVVTPSVLAVGVYVVIRDYVRDVTLQHKGFDVWQSAVNTNWVVVGLFLGTAMVGVAVLLWLAKIIRQVKSVEERYV